jgi:hypothetical protein
MVPTNATASPMPASAEHGFLDSLVMEMVTLFRTLMEAIARFVRELPDRIRFMTTQTILIIVAAGLVLLVVAIMGVVYGAYFVHPRATLISRSIEFHDYMANTYLPRFVRVRAQMNAAAARLKGSGMYEELLARHPSMLSAVQQLETVLPKGDQQCVDFLEGFFSSWSSYRYFENKAMRSFFPVRKKDGDGGKSVSPHEWEKMENLRDALARFALSSTKNNPASAMWVTRGQYNDDNTRVIASMRNRGASYEQYISVARAVAEMVTCILEFHLMLNIYHSSIVTKYDSRQRRAWGNPYIFYYFMGHQTILTSQAIKSTWGSGFSSNVKSYYHSLMAWYDDLWPFLKGIPRMLANQDRGRDSGMPNAVRNAGKDDDSGTGDVGPRPSAARIQQLMDAGA